MTHSSELFKPGILTLQNSRNSAFLSVGLQFWFVRRELKAFRQHIFVEPVDTV